MTEIAWSRSHSTDSASSPQTDSTRFSLALPWRVWSVRRLAPAWLVVAALLLCGAQKPSYPTNRPQTPPEKPEKKTIDIPKVDSKPAGEAKAALTAARTNQTKAEGALGAVAAKLQKSFDASPNVAAAIAAERNTQAAYDAACGPVTASVQARPDYKAADEAVKQADQQMQLLRNNPDATFADRTAAAQKLTDAKTVVTKMTAEALAADPRANAAKAQHATAAASLGKLRKDFEESLKHNAEWLAAKKTLDDARKEMITAQKNADTANKELAKEQAAHDAAVRQQAQADKDYNNKMAAYNQAMNQSNRPPTKGKKS